ncbi:MAG TPA: hypothetical protein VJ140_05050 [Actinomycetota bacterium]|nr:hypothetical protein [Actinomycetota bacterium]
MKNSRIDKILDTIDQALDGPWSAGNQTSPEPSYGGPGSGCVRCGAKPGPSGWCSRCHPARNPEVEARPVPEGAESRASEALRLTPDFRPVPGCLCVMCEAARRQGRTDVPLAPGLDPQAGVGRPLTMAEARLVIISQTRPEVDATAFAGWAEPSWPPHQPGRVASLEQYVDGSWLLTIAPDPVVAEQMAYPGPMTAVERDQILAELNIVMDLTPEGASWVETMEREGASPEAIEALAAVRLARWQEAAAAGIVQLPEEGGD